MLPHVLNFSFYLDPIFLIGYSPNNDVTDPDGIATSNLKTVTPKNVDYGIPH